MRTTARFALVLSLFAHPLFAAGTEIGQRTIAATSYGVSAAATGTNGSNFLTVWRLDTLGGGTHVHGVFADSNGNTTSSSSFPVLTFVDPKATKVVAAGSDYFLFWTDAQNALHMSAIGSDGRATTTRDLAVGPVGRFDAAWNGSRFGLLVREQTSTPVDTFHLLSREGSIERTSRGVWTTSATNSFQLTAMSNGNFLTTSWGASGIYARVLDGNSATPSGQIAIDEIPVDATGFRIAAADAERTAGSGETVVVWTNVAPDRTLLRSAIVGDAGNVQQASNVTLSGDLPYALDLVRSGNGFVALLNVSRPTEVGINEIELNDRAMNIEQQHAVPVTARGRVSIASAASIGGTAYAAAVDSATQAVRILGIRRSGASVQQSVLSQMETRQIGTTIAGEHAAWIDRSADGSAVMAVRVDRDGRPVGAPMEIARSEGVIHEVAIGSSGGNYLVVWREGRQLRGRRLAAGDAFLIRDAEIAEPFVTGNGSEFFVLWSEANRIYGSRIIESSVAAAERLTPDAPLTPGLFPIHAHASAAWSGSKYLVAFTARQFAACLTPPCQEIPDVRAVRVNANGRPQDTTALVLFNDAARPSAASNGSDFYVAARAQSSVRSLVVAEQEGALVNTSPITLFPWWNDQLGVSAVWDGQRYVTSWRYRGADTRAWIATYNGSTRYAETGPYETLPTIASAATITNDTVLVTDEIRSAGGSSRAVSYRPAELTELPARASTPTGITVIDLGSGSYSISWNALGNELGFLIEARAGANFFVAAAAAGNARTITVPNAFPPFRLRAWNAGGVSEASAEILPGLPTLPPRRRSVR